MKKKALVTLLLAALLSLLLCPAALAAGGECGEDAVWSLEKGVLTVSGSGAISDYSLTEGFTAAPWREFAGEITALVIEEGVTAIGSYAFCALPALERVSIPDTVTELGQGVFSGDVRLNGVVLPASLEAIGKAAFYNCSSLTDITLPAQLVSVGESAFEGCVALADIALPETVTELGYWCFSKTALPAFAVPAGVTVLHSGVFAHCAELESVTLPAVLQEIEPRAFENSAITSITIPAGVTAVRQDAFAQCYDLKMIRFLGNAPAMDSNIFDFITAEVFYPAEAYGWNADTMRQYGGSITWQSEGTVGGFTDVPASAYYKEPVLWAVSAGITNGVGEGLFGPEASCTRGQVVTFLWRAFGSPAADGVNPFGDVAADAYYHDAVLWAAEKGITSGTGANVFSPGTACTRGQVVTFLWRAAGSPQAAGENPFADVRGGDYYYDAVLWAVEQGVTSGTAADAFSPGAECTRGQIVTFLYRAVAAGGV